MLPISICIPTFNRREYLHRAVISALYQLETGDEIVVQDNCSEDGTSEMMKECFGHDRRVNYFRNKTNVGGVMNFGCVVESALNEHIYLLTDDDYLLPEAIKKVRLFFQTNDVRIFKTAYFQFNENSRTGGFVSAFKSDMGRLKLSIEDAVTIYKSSHIYTGLCFEKKLFNRGILEANRNNWYPSMLFVGVAGLKIGYLSEPTNIHTWENVTHWGIDPNKLDELNRGEVEIIKYLFENKYISYEHFREMVVVHVTSSLYLDNSLIINSLQPTDSSRVSNLVRRLKSKNVAKGIVGRIKNVLKSML